MELRTAYDIIEKNLGVFVVSRGNSVVIRFINTAYVKQMVPKELWGFLEPQMDAFFSYFTEDLGLFNALEEYLNQAIDREIIVRIKHDITSKIEEIYQEPYMDALKLEFRRAYLE